MIIMIPGPPHEPPGVRGLRGQAAGLVPGREAAAALLGPAEALLVPGPLRAVPRLRVFDPLLGRCAELAVGGGVPRVPPHGHFLYDIMLNIIL